MQLPLQITFRNMEPTPALEATIRERASRLDTFASQVMSCRVVVEPAGRHHEHGNQFTVRIDITLPGDEIVATREPSEHTEYQQLAVALRDAFDAAARQLEDYVRRQRADVKSHVPTPHGKVTRLLPEQDYGFLTTSDGREIYFHRNSVLNDAYEQLAIGTEVAFAEEEGNQGPQASTVKVVGRHGGG